jgi:multidrug resistance efflux pump
MDRVKYFHWRRWLAGALAIALSSGGSAHAAPQTTGAMGQIVPAGGIVGVTGAPGSMVTKVYVHPGQEVKAGTLLMSTEAQTPDTDPALARKQLQVAQELSVEQVEAQTETVALAQSRNDQAKTALATYQGLGSSIVSKKEMDGYIAAAGDAAKTLAAEEARLKAAKAQAQGNLNAARRQLEATVDGTELRATVDGTVLKITRQPGERLGSDPAVQLGDLSTMYVVSQVDEDDLLRLKPGMAATITAQPLSKPLHGRIEEIGRLIDTQARLGEVRIRLDSADPASRMVGMQVDVAIEH